MEFCEKGEYGRANRVGLNKIISGVVLLPKRMKSLIINGPNDGAIMRVCRVDRANWRGPMEFLKMVFSKINRKLIAILLGPESFLILCVPKVIRRKVIRLPKIIKRIIIIGPA